jgi:hypothetical protein
MHKKDSVAHNVGRSSQVSLFEVLREALDEPLQPLVSRVSGRRADLTKNSVPAVHDPEVKRIPATAERVQEHELVIAGKACDATEARQVAEREVQGPKGVGPSVDQVAKLNELSTIVMRDQRRDVTQEYAKCARLAMYIPHGKDRRLKTGPVVRAPARGEHGGLLDTSSWSRGT